MKAKISKAVRKGFSESKIDTTFTEAHIQSAVDESIEVWAAKGGTDKLLELYAKELTAHHACKLFDDTDNNEIAKLAYRAAMWRM